MNITSENNIQPATPSSDKLEAKAKFCCAWTFGLRKVFYLLVIIILAVAGVVAWDYSQGGQFKDLFSPQTSRVISDKTVDQTILRAMELQIRVADEKINSLTARLEKLESNPPVETSGNNAVGAAETKSNSDQAVARLKSDMISLTAALSALQGQLLQSVQSADKTKDDTKASIAVVIAFTQLRNAADAGKGFAKELQSLRQTSGDDAALLEQAAVLEPIAANGAPVISVLRDEYVKLVSQAQASLRKSEAQNWKDRLLAELQGLISIRTINSTGDNSDPFGAIEEDLGQGNLDAVIANTDKLPEAAKTVLKDWRAKVEARKNTENAINAIAEHLITKAHEDQVAPDIKQ